MTDLRNPNSENPNPMKTTTTQETLKDQLKDASLFAAYLRNLVEVTSDGELDAAIKQLLECREACQRIARDVEESGSLEVTIGAIEDAVKAANPPEFSGTAKATFPEGAR